MLQVQDLEGELDSVKNQLHQMSHTLSDREAQLNMQTNNVAVRSRYVMQCFLINSAVCFGYLLSTIN